MSLAETTCRLLVVDEHPTRGGIERMCLFLMPELAKRCEALVWLVPEFRREVYAGLDRGNASFASINWPAGSFQKLFHASVKRAARLLGPGTARKAETWLHDRRLRHLIREHRISHVFYPALFGQDFPVIPLPVNALVHDLNYPAADKAHCLENLAQWIERRARIITISHFVARELEEFAGRRDMITGVVHHSVELPENTASTPRPQAVAEPALYYPAGLKPTKGHSFLLAVFETLRGRRPCRLVFSGRGTDDLFKASPLSAPELEEARRRTAKLGPQAVTAHGYLADDRVNDVFAVADVVTLPSRHEGFGMPLLEAVAQRRPVVASDIPPFREQVERFDLSRVVALVAPEDAAGWLAAIERFLDTPPAPAEYEGCLDRIRNWTWGHVAEAYLVAITKPVR
jgi:glycosyltransferase involved in cell wall biosynthesis